jgi:hypothetical protein
MSQRNPASPAVALPRARPGTTTQAGDGNGQQLTELPAFNPSGLNLNDYATYVRKMTSGGPQDFHAPLGTLLAQMTFMVATNKAMLRSFSPQAAYQIAFCLGGNSPNDNQGGIYFTETSSDVDNGGDRIRPDNYIGLVWYKFLI